MARGLPGPAGDHRGARRERRQGHPDLVPLADARSGDDPLRRPRPLEHKVLVVKSTIHYRAAFEPIAREIVEVDAPGLSSSNLARFDFKRIRRPIFPLDPDTTVPADPRQGGSACRSPASPPLTSRYSTSTASRRGWRRSGAASGPSSRRPGASSCPTWPASAAREAFAHVAKHMRRTVNPPDDTWVAFAADKRGYKKHCHFKVAISRGAVRFLFEAGPEHAQKKQWSRRGSATPPSWCPCSAAPRGWRGSRTSTTRRPRPFSPICRAEEVARLVDELTPHARRPARPGPRGRRRGGRALEARRLRPRRARDVSRAGAAV